MNGQRYLVVIADDFGIGPATSRAILDLAPQGRVTGAVLLVNSPYAEQAVRWWRQARAPLELGWHPNLTLDAPVLPTVKVPSLVAPDGSFWRLGQLVRRLLLGRIHRAHLEAELRAQYGRYVELVGRPPGIVNAHQHIALFPPVGNVLLDLLKKMNPLPYVRRVREPLRLLARVPGARVKRAFLTLLGRRLVRRQRRDGFPGNDWLAGITDPPWVKDPNFLVRWLTQVPGAVVELACHPGYLDRTLIDRDCTEHDGLLQRRADELRLLQQPSFPEACRRAGFTLLAPSQLIALRTRGLTHAA